MKIYFIIKGEEGFSLWNHTTGDPLKFKLSTQNEFHMELWI